VLLALGFVVSLMLGLALLRFGGWAGWLGIVLCMSFLVGGGVVWIMNGPHRPDIV
jgi:hypothetical protein